MRSPKPASFVLVDNGNAQANKQAKEGRTKAQEPTRPNKQATNLESEQTEQPQSKVIHWAYIFNAKQAVKNGTANHYEKLLAVKYDDTFKDAA